MISSTEPTYRSFWDEAVKFHKGARGGRVKRPEVFSNDILYNMLAMSIEKYFMAFLIYNNDMADNHTFRDLIDSVNRTKIVPLGLCDRLIRLEELQNLCPLNDAYAVKETSDEVIDEMLLVVEDVQKFCTIE